MSIIFVLNYTGLRSFLSKHLLVMATASHEEEEQDDGEKEEEDEEEIALHITTTYKML